MNGVPGRRPMPKFFPIANIGPGRSMDSSLLFDPDRRKSNGIELILKLQRNRKMASGHQQLMTEATPLHWDLFSLVGHSRFKGE
jgi:hypothetical protein